jgi:hypothetical protein
LFTFVHSPDVTTVVTVIFERTTICIYNIGDVGDVAGVVVVGLNNDVNIAELNWLRLLTDAVIRITVNLGIAALLDSTHNHTFGGWNCWAAV